MIAVYVAHPYGGDADNLARARRWYRWLCVEFPRCAFVSQWLLEVELFDDADPEARRAGLARDCELVRRCDALLLVGGRRSQGMAHEADAARAAGKAVIDVTSLGTEPPELRSLEWTRDPWIATVAAVLSAGQPLPSEVG